MMAALVLSVFAAAQDSHDKKGRYLVKSNDKLLKTAFTVQHNFEGGFTSELTKDQAKALEQSGVDVEEVPLYYLLAKPSVATRTCTPSVQKPWGVVKVNGGSGGAGVNVTVLDTGVNKNHLDLSVKLCKDATKSGIQNGCSDRNGHGTHVSGTIAANGGADGKGIFGVAPQANLWMVKVCGSGGSCWSDDIATAIRYAADQGTNIISMSLGSNSESTLIRDAITYAVGKGVLVVAAAGNDGPEDGSIDWPGANAAVVAVGAIDSAEAVASWSSRGVNDGDYVKEAREVEFGAPGVSVLSTWSNGCYATLSGTSMATPHVSGLAAKLWQGSAAATRQYLQDMAKLHDLHTAGDDTATGFGLPVSP